MHIDCGGGRDRLRARAPSANYADAAEGLRPSARQTPERLQDAVLCGPSAESRGGDYCGNDRSASNAESWWLRPPAPCDSGARAEAFSGSDNRIHVLRSGVTERRRGARLRRLRSAAGSTLRVAPAHTAGTELKS